MAVDKTEAAGETRLSADPDIRLHGEDEAGQMSGRRDLAGLAIAVALFALAAIIYSDASGYESRQSYAQFGPEIVPFVVAAGVAVLAGLTTLAAWRGQFEIRDRMHWGGFLWVTAAIMAQIAMLYSGAGFILASTVLFALAARGFGQKTHLLNLAIGAVMSGLLFVLFRYGLGLALPSGPVERIIDQFLR